MIVRELGWPTTSKVMFEEIAIEWLEESHGGVHLMSDICTIGILLDEFCYFFESSFRFADASLELGFVWSHKNVYCIGGICESRTRLGSFAGSCMTALPRRQNKLKIYWKTLWFQYTQNYLVRGTPTSVGFFIDLCFAACTACRLARAILASTYCAAALLLVHR